MTALRLSTAILRGAVVPVRATVRPYYCAPGSMCPLGAAHLGSMTSGEIDDFWPFIAGLGHEAACDVMHRGLMRSFPQLGQSIRSMPRLVSALAGEAPGLFPRRGYVSVWRVACVLHGAGRRVADVADVLAKGGL